jgi:hypothetical protein
MLTTKISRRIARPGRPSAAVVISSLALFSGLGGVGYAAATIGSSDIKNNAVQGVDIKNGTIKTADIAAGTRNALKGQTGPAGPAGPAGAAGAAGPQGPQGPVGPSNARSVTENTNKAWTVGLQNIVNLELPAGNWAVTGTSVLNNNDADDERIVPCQMQSGATTLATLGEGVEVGAQVDNVADRVSITMQGLVALPAGGTVSLQCTPGVTTGNYLVSKLQAIRVGAIG